MSDATDLLRSLAGIHASRLGATAGSAQGTTTVPAVTSNGESFATLLEQARTGQIGSGVPLRVPSQLGLNLNPSQVERLMSAADQAEAQGAGRALVLMDGKAITIDVGTRTVTGTVDPSAPGVLPGIDAVVVAAADPKDAVASSGTQGGGAGVLAMPKGVPAFLPQVAKVLAGASEAAA